MLISGQFLVTVGQAMEQLIVISSPFCPCEIKEWSVTSTLFSGSIGIVAPQRVKHSLTSSGDFIDVGPHLEVHLLK